MLLTLKSALYWINNIPWVFYKTFFISELAAKSFISTRYTNSIPLSVCYLFVYLKFQMLIRSFWEIFFFYHEQTFFFKFSRSQRIQLERFVSFCLTLGLTQISFLWCVTTLLCRQCTLHQ